MYFRNCLLVATSGAAFLFSTAALAQTGAPAPAAASQTPVSTGAAQVATGGTRVHGTITDPDGYPIPGALVTLVPAKGGPRTVKTGQDGSYATTVTPGTYNVSVTMQGFASYSMKGLKVPAVAGATVDAKLAVGEATQVINVDASAMEVSVDPDSNASATVLSGKDLDALSDDPDELQSELEALAGPSAGPNGGQIYVDGFTGGQLPPKSSIREIRINQNPFSAQFDKLGYGRVEVFTKPGTDQLHGSLSMNGNLKQLNAGRAPVQPGTTDQPIPDYHTFFIFGSITGPISKHASFNVGGYHRDIQDAVITNATILALPGAPTTPCIAGSSATFGSCVSTPFTANTFQPQARTEITPRVDLALGANNVLTTMVEVQTDERVNTGVGGLNFSNVGTHSSSSSLEIRMLDTQNFGLHVVNETRGEWERERSNSSPNSSGVLINASGAFEFGGSPNQGASTHTDQFELQNYTSIQAKKNFIRFGGRLRANREAINSNANVNGQFTYAGLSCATTNCPNGAGGLGDYTYATGVPSQFSQTIVNNHDIHNGVTDVGLYAETDWKVQQNFTLTYGVRYETQNYISDRHDWSPRLAFAYGVGNKAKPMTVIRGGVGIFYDRFTIGNLISVTRSNGSNTTAYTVKNNLQAGNSIPTTCTPTNTSSCLSGAASQSQSVVSVPGEGTGKIGLSSPYIIQTAIGVDQQIGKLGLASINWIHTEGAHLLSAANVACNPNPLTGVCQSKLVNNQFLDIGHFHQNALSISPRLQLTKWLSIFGQYQLTYSDGNSAGTGLPISNPVNINADLGHLPLDVRHHYFFFGSVTLPHYISLSPFVIGQSGSPYNITEGQDLNADGNFYDRPLLVAAGTPGAKTIAGCGTFLSHQAGNAPAGSQTVPNYYCHGPSLFTLNMRVTKTWGFGDKHTSQGQGGGDSGGPPPGGQHSGGGSHGGGSHGGGPGGPGGGGMFGGGGSSTGKKYNFSLGAYVSDLTNRQNLASPVGTITSPIFGQSYTLAGQPFTSANALFHLALTASFSF